MSEKGERTHHKLKRGQWPRATATKFDVQPHFVHNHVVDSFVAAVLRFPRIQLWRVDIFGAAPRDWTSYAYVHLGTVLSTVVAQEPRFEF